MFPFIYLIFSDETCSLAYTWEIAHNHMKLTY